jgi:hypothetical protein
MDNPTLVGSDLYGIGREYKITAADFVKLGVATGGNIILGDLPQGSIMQEVVLKNTVALAGTPTPTCTVQLISVDLGTTPPAQVNTFGGTLNAVTPPSATNIVQAQLTSANTEPFDKKTALAAKVTGTNLTTVTAGSISMFARYKAIAPATPLRFDTTAQTPRAMPAY